MPVKSRTSTQQAYMKLLLVVAILICTDVAVANSTSELMEHRRLGGAWTSLLKWFGARTVVDTEVVDTEVVDTEVVDTEVVDKVVSFEDEWENAFRLQARQHLADSKKNTDSSLLTKELAQKVEWRLLPQWNAKGNTLSELFKALHLKEMKTEEELYANPAFITWMNFAFHLHTPHGAGYNLDGNTRRKAFISMLEVLQENMKKLRGFKDVLKLRPSTEEGTNDLKNNKKLTELFQKWQAIYDNHAPKHLPDTKTNTMSDTSADLHKFLPDLLSKIDSTSTIKEQLDVTLKVLRENRFSDAELVKMINAGLMDRSLTTRMWANKMESRLLQLWKSDGKTLRNLFIELKLNEVKTEIELYANPAFTTWMNFAFQLQRDESTISEYGIVKYALDPYARRDAFQSMLVVLQEMENTKDFEGLLTLRAKTENGPIDLQNTLKLTELFDNWEHVSSRQWLWNEIVKP